MGFGDSATQIIFFILLVIVSSSLVLLFSDFTQSQESMSDSQSSRFVEQLETSVSVTSIAYDPNSEQMLLYIRNTGLRDIPLSELLLIINGDFFHMNNADYVIEEGSGPSFENILEVDGILRVQATISQTTTLFQVQVQVFGNTAFSNAMPINTVAVIPP